MQKIFGMVLFILVAMFGLAQLVVPDAADGEDEGGAFAAESSDGASKTARRKKDSGSTLDEIEISRDASGQFHLTAVANGSDTPFLIDTGADMVAITVAAAEDMGIDVDPEAFQPIARTASGTGYGMPVQIERFEVGGRELTDVDAVVMDGLSTNLLGQSVLGQLGSVELRGDTMVIRPD